MPSFTYTALDATGNTVRGSVATRNKAEAYRELDKLALLPVTVSEERAGTAEGAGGAAENVRPPRLKRSEVIHFTSELADMLDAGLQLERALRVMEERSAEPALRTVSLILRREIREGRKISAALRQASPSFDDLYVNLVAAGEASGSLPEILRRLARNLQVMHDLQSRVVGAMIYPMFLIAACTALVFAFSTVLMPQLTDLLGSSKQGMPLLTSLLVAFSDFMGRWWWMLLAGGVAGFLGFKGWVATPRGRRWWDEHKLRVPLFGPVLAAHFYAQFCQSLGNLVQNGVPLLNGLKLMLKAIPNVFLRERLAAVTALVAEGGALSGAMRKAEAFPPLLVDMLAVGEQTGNIGQAFAKLAARYDKELTLRIDRLTKLISPVVLIFMALIVGVVAYTIVTTLFQSAAGIRGRA
jgi:general secretion pathway protein F/type IV pilus assembly protein PilC